MKKEYQKTVTRILATVMGIVLSAGLSFGFGVHVWAQTDKGRVLFISSYSYAWDTVQIQIEGIKKGISEGTVLDYEFMDTKRVDDETAYRLFYEGLSYRLSKVEPYDAVILGDDAALKFALEYREELFDGIPLIFEGVNDLELAVEVSQNPLITGVVEKLSFQKNIELALTIYPDATKVVGILDNSITGEAERKNFYQNAELYPNLEFSEINTSELTTAGLKKALSNLEKDTILIYVVMTEDASGKQYTNQESIELIAKFAAVPAFRMVEGGIGYGVLGGNIVSMERSGQIAAEIAMDIIEGRRNMSEVGVIIDSPNVYCIDEVVMEKFGIEKSLLPEDTIFVNHKPTFIERNREALLPSTILFAALLVIVLWVCVDNIKKRKLTAALEEARMYLEDASQHDFLTTLPNRSKFMKDLGETIGGQSPCTVIMLDIDNFKKINDTYGHIIGDEALKQVAARLKALKTQILTPYRFAGDEFILLIRSDNSKIINTAAVQCLSVFQKPFKLMGAVHDIRGSIGIASYPKDAKDGEQLIVCADAAMYEVKKSGKNAFAYYNNEKQ
ncbi:MAG: diguanylate cyclase [Lachnospiraceae bacterium]|nr:diguanylate cyclase [Lachnospiraceae bacterium]